MNALEVVIAQKALQAAGVPAGPPLERASSVTNHVFLTSEHVVRLSRQHDNRLFREARLLDVLPPQVRAPVAVASGSSGTVDWLVLERVPGQPLSRSWPDLSVEQRRRAIAELASILRALHTAVAPEGLEPVGSPHLLQTGGGRAVAPLLDALDRACSLAHSDGLLLRHAIDLVESTARSIEPFQATTLIHGDLTFENVLWSPDGGVSALLDFEFTRPAPPDLDLDVLLRCCAYPHLHVAADYEHRTRPEDYAQVPIWLAEDDPDLFATGMLADRLRIYSLAYNVRELLESPPVTPTAAGTERDPMHRIALVLGRDAPLDRFLARL